MKKVLFILIAATTMSCVDTSDKAVQKELDKINSQVATDFEEQYRIAKEAGSAMDAYVQAGLVAAAYLQAKDTENFKKWKEIENQEALNAGVYLPD